MGNLAVWLERRYQVHKLRQEQATERQLRTVAQSMSRDMKSSHPWTNRTTDAEKSLGALVERQQRGAETTFVVRAGYVLPPRVHYGIWLELAHAGVWAVVRPTVLRYRSRVSQQVRQARRVR
jgi:hypothetical protein